MAIDKAEIRDRILRDRLITPVLDLEQQLRGDGSLDVRLGHQFLVFNKATGVKAIDPTEGDALRRQLQEHHQSMIRVSYGKQFHLHPGDFVIARTFEYLTVPSNWIGYVLGRSSWGRLGVVIATATFINPRFQGTITLEIANLGLVPVSLTPLSRVAQLVFDEVDNVALRKIRSSSGSSPEQDIPRS
jgi:dCTP deaminase